MRLKELADAFGWTIYDLAEVMGYSTPGLYHIFQGHNIDRRRLFAALDHLQLISHMKYEQEIDADDQAAPRALAEKQRRDGCLRNVKEMVSDRNG